MAEDYVGGLAGYISTGTVKANYSNVAIVGGKNARQTGRIAGGATAIEGSLVGLSDSFYANYYVGGNGDDYGMAGIAYGKNYKYAATGIASEALIAMNLGDDFTDDDWQKGENAYPIPKGYYNDYADTDVQDLFDDDERFNTYIASVCPTLLEKMGEAARPYAVTVFLEWNEDDGDLYDEDDGSVLTENAVRNPKGWEACLRG
jgi:hypothetical protein